MSDKGIIDELKEESREFLEKLQQERDELRLQSHLLKAELKDEWDVVEKKWQALERRLHQFNHDARESAEDIGIAIEMVGQEIALAYRQIRQKDE